ncbi:carbamate kinase [Enterobacter cloacae]|uniref:Carbamate kinase n=1 Tax=Enterobacter cloacae TaxID=550 RepID=A0A377LTQ0_ENTCL|nr:carbamate kinase [Enterobacter cloacae]
MKELMVVAIGGNSIIKDNASQSVEHQAQAVKAVAESVLEMLASDYDIVLTHGNGPQVGLDLRRAEIAHEREGLPLTPLANCVADTQGGIGYLIQQALNNRLSARGEQKRSPSSLRWRWIKTIRALATRPSPSAHSSAKRSAMNCSRRIRTGTLLRILAGAIVAWWPRRSRYALLKPMPLRP